MSDDTQNQTVVSQQIIGIGNLSSEVLEKVALQLAFEDYVALRQIDKRTCQSLLSVKVMNEKINQGLSGERVEPYKKMVDAAKSDYITKAAHGAIRDALQTIEVQRYCIGGESGNNAPIALDCRYRHDLPGKREVVKVLKTFAGLIPGAINFKHGSGEQRGLRISLILVTCDDLKSIRQIFASANQVFNQCTGGEKLVLASLINALKLYLCGRFAEADINNLAALYPDVFSMGEIIHKMYPPEVNVDR